MYAPQSRGGRIHTAFALDQERASFNIRMEGPQGRRRMTNTFRMMLSAVSKIPAHVEFVAAAHLGDRNL